MQICHGSPYQDIACRVTIPNVQLSSEFDEFFLHYGILGSKEINNVNHQVFSCFALSCALLWLGVHITMTSYWARWRLKSPVSRLFTQTLIQAQIKENINAPRHWPLWGEFTGDRWILRTKDQ